MIEKGNGNQDLDNAEWFNLLDKMYDDHLAGPKIYQASKFWDMLNQLNVKWLRDDGLDNFKRTVNNNYFNWMVNSKSVYFRNVFHDFLPIAFRQPKRLLSLLMTGIDEMSHRTYVSDNTQCTWFQRKLYALYLFLLHEYVLRRDEFGVFRQLSEPNIGNPLVISKEGKNISQDISNSYMEYSFIRGALKDEFSSVKVIAEIGAGYGRLAYLFHLLHADQGMKVVLVDLPPALLVSQWYLSTVFPSAKVMKYRKFSDFSEVESEFDAASICFLLPHQLEKLPEGKIDILINVSSLQEMSRQQINNYYSIIDSKARYFYTKQWSMWENPEDKISVPAVIYPTRPDWRLLNARINPIHTEFFEALFEVM